MKPSLAIVIVNWNTGSALAECLQSVARANRDTAFDLVRIAVVDNASSDNSWAIPPSDLPITVLRNSSNRGFAAACNQGARDCPAEYILFLNPDATVTRASLESPIAFLMAEEKGSVGICGVAMRDGSGAASTCAAKFPTAGRILAKSLGLDRLFHRFGSHINGTSAVTARLKVDHVIGAFFMIRARLFAELGGFDERFFLYYEEVDLSLRAWRRGYSSHVLLDVHTCHTGCQSSNRVKDKRLFYSVQSRLRYADKHFSIAGRLTVRLASLLIEPGVRLLHGTLALSRAELITTLRGYGYLYRALAREFSA